MFKLTLNQTIPTCDVVPEYDDELDDVRSILSDICDFMEEGSHGKFSVDPIGDETWPVDVGTDLPVFLEQVPDALRDIEAAEPDFAIDFYEQGVEKRLVFRRGGHELRVECQSMTGRNVSVATQFIRVQELQDELLCVQKDFMAFVESAFPQLHDHPWLLVWFNASKRTREGD